MTDAVQLVSVDLDSYYQDPLGFFAWLRESRPVAPVRMPNWGRAWIVTRYEHARVALTDPRLAKDVHRWPGGAQSRPSEADNLHAHMLHQDGADHTRMRRLVQKAFTPRRAAALRPRAQEIVAGLADQMAARAGVIDLLDSYARPLPITVICELLGVPEADRGWMAAIVADYDRREESARVTRELAAYFTALIAARRAEPGDDLVSALVSARDRAEEDGAPDRLTGTELLSTVFQLVMAGFDTTVNLIASGTLALLAHPGEMARLREDPSLLPAAVEELLRFTSPVNHATDRFTTEEVTIGGVVIPAGEWVLIAVSSAGRDPARFPDPDRLDLGRDTSGHLAFGYGVHYCLGAPLARMEAEVAVGALLARFPRMSLAVPRQELRWRPVSLMNGLESLPVRLA
ncbi:MAG TPA: cytochrome P450 [Trebonia sp.]|nr:cytochrome P450 [Trebonia sp.]